MAGSPDKPPTGFPADSEPQNRGLPQTTANPGHPQSAGLAPSARPVDPPAAGPVASDNKPPPQTAADTLELP